MERPEKSMEIGGEKGLNPFTFKDFRGKMVVSESSADLDNLDSEKHAQTAVQTSREMTTSNGCHVTLVFPRKSRTGVRRRIAEMFIAALEKGMNDS